MGLNSPCRVSVFKSDQLLNVIDRPFDKVFADFLHDRTTKCWRVFRSDHT